MSVLDKCTKASIILSASAAPLGCEEMSVFTFLHVFCDHVDSSAEYLHYNARTMNVPQGVK